jgi:hypothetical protein
VKAAYAWKIDGLDARLHGVQIGFLWPHNRKEIKMFGFVRAIRNGLAFITVVAMLMAVPLPSYAAVGTVRLKIVKAGFIVGVGGGSGVLHFEGRNYPLRIGGISVGTIGAAGADLVGRAYNLHRAEDITGTYTAVSGSIAIAGGAKIVQLQNSTGVVLKLQGRQAGFEASASLSGMSISLR